MLKSLNICRICGSRGDYDIFNVIPAYLHENVNEFLYWKKDISKLIEETTGLVISPEDDFPNKICAICVSYLKHASSFREQAITSALSFKASLQTKLKIPLEECDLEFNRNRITEIQNLFNMQQPDNDDSSSFFKKFTNIPKDTKNQSKPKLVEEENLNTCLNSMFDTNTSKKREPVHRRRQVKKKKVNQEELTGTTSDEYHDDEADYFDYKEKNFVEDDVLIDILKISNVTINVPEYYTERKCRACFKRFMFDESFKDHTEKFCVEYKFLLLIEECNRLLTIRRRKAVSAHEYIRRMIFSLRKVIESLNTTCNDEVLPKLLEKNNCETDKKTDKNIPDSLKIVKLNKKVHKETTTLDPLKSFSKTITEWSHFNYSSRQSSNSTVTDPIIENSSNSYSSPPIIKFATKCDQCAIYFESITSLEQHNAINHNNLNKNDKHKAIIALFEDDE